MNLWYTTKSGENFPMALNILKHEQIVAHHLID